MAHWVLTIRTSLPGVCWDDRTLKPSVYVYDSFEDGKSAFLSRAKEYALADNAMFDGHGNIKHLQKYAEDCPHASEVEEGVAEFTYELVMEIVNALQKALLGKHVSIPEIPEMDEAWYRMITVVNDGESLELYGDFDGPMNGINPMISTNIFDLNTEKDLHLYIDDMFDQEVSSSLFIDLVKAE